MQRLDPWYLGERAEILAHVALTRLPGVTVESPQSDTGIDLLVTLPSRRGGRIFGIQVKGVRGIRQVVAPDGRVEQKYVEHLERQTGDAPFPVGLLIFDMSDDSGYFGWYLEPASAADGACVGVHRRSEISVEKLADDLLSRIVADVGRWYDTRVPAH